LKPGILEQRRGYHGLVGFERMTRVRIGPSNRWTDMVPGIPVSAIQDDDLYYPIIPTVIKPLYYNGTDRNGDSRTNKVWFWNPIGVNFSVEESLTRHILADMLEDEYDNNHDLFDLEHMTIEAFILQKNTMEIISLGIHGQTTM